ncbi:MAG: hypothetical protein NTX45_07690 [Proteobacteria bacterium]|nr:hypothetical protein [Pseudomonadota bacterium]
MLLGLALRHLPLAVYAWQRALERHEGLGQGKIARLKGIVYLPPAGGVQPVLAGRSVAIPGGAADA